MDLQEIKSAVLKRKPFAQYRFFPEMGHLILGADKEWVGGSLRNEEEAWEDALNAIQEGRI